MSELGRESAHSPRRTPVEQGNRDAWNPDQYARFKNERTQPFYDLLAMVEPRPEGMRAIDLGCGTGEFTRHLHDSLGCRETIGLDNSPAMLARTSAHEGNGVRFVVGDFGDTRDGRIGTVVEGPFDLVFSNAALHWLGDHDDLIPRITSLLAPGGQLVVQVPMNGDHPSHVVAATVAREEPFASALGGHVRVFGTRPPEVYAEMLWRLGAPDPKCVTRVYGHVMTSSADVVEWVKGTLLTDYQSRLRPPLFDAFIDRYREALRAVLGDQAPYYYAFKRVLFQARWPM
jgi:trans-aconitate 2-methyltransferase